MEKQNTGKTKQGGSMLTPTDPIYGLIALSAITSWAVLMYLYFAWQLSGWMTEKYIEWKLRRFHSKKGNE
tara:strand:+ start:137 stop:346 length:210 start_codon:yes stop_codon:yes gene_type:complete